MPFSILCFEGGGGEINVFGNAKSVLFLEKKSFVQNFVQARN